jgi:hypothetical protein
VADPLSITQIHCPHPCPVCGEHQRRFVTDSARTYIFGIFAVCTQCAGVFVMELPDFEVRRPTPDEIFVLCFSERRPAIEKIVRVLRRPRKGVAE